MSLSFKKVFLLSCISILGSCTDVSSADDFPQKHESILVIEGGLTNERKPHEIKLSYFGLIGDAYFSPAHGATVFVINGRDSIRFNELEPGSYMSDSFQVQEHLRYDLVVERKVTFPSLPFLELKA